jgi:acyl-CoA thioester hydrolase
MNGYPVIVEQTVAWRDMDSFGHVNNVVFFHYFEIARIELLSRLGWLLQKQTEGIGPIVASTSAKFRKALTYPDRLRIGARIGLIRSDRVTIEHAIESESLQAVCCDGEAVVVNYDYRQLAKRDFSEAMAKKLSAFSP